MRRKDWEQRVEAKVDALVEATRTMNEVLGSLSLAIQSDFHALVDRIEQYEQAFCSVVGQYDPSVDKALSQALEAIGRTRA